MDRFREQVLKVNEQWGPSVPYHWNVTTSAPCASPPQNQVAGSSYLETGSEIRRTTDTVNPAWRRRIANGEIINAPFSTTYEKTEPPSFGSYSQSLLIKDYTTCSGVKYDGTLHIVAPQYRPMGTRVPEFLVKEEVPLDVGAIQALAVTNAHANVDVAEMQALATVAEGRKTVQSMASILMRLVSVMRKVRKLDIRALRKELSRKELADRYMELRYAIRPLIYDARGIAKALERESEHIRRTAVGYASGSASHTDQVLRSFAYYANAWWTRNAQYSVSARAGVLCSVNVDAVNIWGVDQAVETLWELTPFSFIVDWFVNVGDTIAAWTPNAGVSQQASWVTVKENFTASNTTTTLVAVPWSYTEISQSYSGCTTTHTQKVTRRVVNPPLSILPSFNMRLDGYKLTDLGIILKRMVA